LAGFEAVVEVAAELMSIYPLSTPHGAQRRARSSVSVHPLTGERTGTASLRKLIQAAYLDIKLRVENG
jgi:hypothetical protein